MPQHRDFALAQHPHMQPHFGSMRRPTLEWMCKQKNKQTLQYLRREDIWISSSFAF
jgi:hypothetical protein